MDRRHYVSLALSYELTSILRTLSHWGRTVHDQADVCRLGGRGEVRVDFDESWAHADKSRASVKLSYINWKAKNGN